MGWDGCGLLCVPGRLQDRADRVAIVSPSRLCGEQAVCTDWEDSCLLASRFNPGPLGEA